MNKSTQKIFSRLIAIGLALAIVVVALQDRENVPGITFATHGIDLKIDSRAYYNGVSVPSSTWVLKDLTPTADHFFNFGDIKPGDYGRTIISTHVSKSPAYLCLDFSNLKGKENGINEPESHVDTSPMTSELAQGTKFLAWIDNGDGIYKPGEKLLFGGVPQPASVVLNNRSYVIGDSQYGGSCKVGNSKYVGIAWCAGSMMVNQTTGALSCNGAALGNEAQTDSFSVDVGIRAMPSNENPRFTCGNVSGGGHVGYGNGGEEGNDRDGKYDGNRNNDGHNGYGENGGNNVNKR